MSRRVRLVFFTISALGFLSLYLWGLRGVPPLGHYRGPYGDVVNSVATYERHVTDVVAAVNFDYRGFDTLGEEFILFISVMGVTLLLRKEEHPTRADRNAQQTAAKAEYGDDEDNQQDEAQERSAPHSSDATRVLSLGLVGPLVLFGIYTVTHGQLTPGGGFQGGVLLATAPLLVYLAGDFRTFKGIVSHRLVEVADALGAGGYILIGCLGLAFGGVFLQNVLPLGRTGTLTSSGTIALINLTVGLEVAAAFLLLLYAFLEETLARLEERERS